MGTEEKKYYTLVDFLGVVRKYYKMLSLVFLISVIVSSIIAFFVMDQIFLSVGVVKSSGKGGSPLGALASFELPGLGDFGEELGGGSSAKELALYEQILYSRRCVEEAIIKFNLMDVYKHKLMFDAVKNFRENVMEVQANKLAGTLSIGIYDKDPVRAKDIADFLIDKLNTVNIELNVQEAKNNRIFIENRYNLVKSDLSKVEDELMVFQDEYGISPEIQVQASAKMEIELEAEIKFEEIKLELLSKIVSKDQPEILAQNEKIAALKTQLNKIQTNNYSDSKLSLGGSPEVVLNFIRLKRNVEIQNKILSTIVPLLEQAKIEENKNTPTLLVIDAPNVPDKKAKPKRSLVILFITMIVMFLTYIILFIKDNVLPKISNSSS